jgi:uncharacterized protein
VVERLANDQVTPGSAENPAVGPATVTGGIGLRDKLEQDYRSALKSRDAARVSVIRMVKAALQNADKAKGTPLSGEELVGVITREAKLRRESLSEFERGGSPDLVAPQAQALEILSEYLPPQLSEAEIRDLVEQAISSLDQRTLENGPGASGAVMRAVMPELRGRADGAVVSRIVAAALTGKAAGK